VPARRHPPPQNAKDTVMSSWEFPVTEPIRLHAQIPAGDIRVIAEPGTTVATVSLDGRGRRSEQLIEETEVSFTGGTLSVLTPDKIRLLSNVSLDLVVHLPEGSAAELRAASADIRCEGELSDLEARTASGDITAGPVTGAARLTSASGDVRFGADVTVSRLPCPSNPRRASLWTWTRLKSVPYTLGMP